MLNLLLSLLAIPFVLLLLLILFVLITIAVHIVRDWTFRRRFRAKWSPAGKFVLFVYSNSPNWQSYIENTILPEISPVAVTLNWSERKRLEEEASLEFRAFRFWAGEREFNPVAIVVPPAGRVKVVRFWKAFRDYKHGKPHALHAAERRLRALIEQCRLRP